MTRRSDERQHSQTELRPDDARFVARLAAHYAPEPFAGVERSAFEARLRERLEAQGRPRWLAPALLAAASAAALAGAVALSWLGSPAAREAGSAIARAPATSSWERTLFYTDGSAPGLAAESESGLLPPDYEAIETVFFDG